VTSAEFWVPVIALGIAVAIAAILRALAKREEG
jgi:hypothetical protein